MHAIDITIAANAGMLFVFDCESGMWDSGEGPMRIKYVELRYIVLVPCARVILFWSWVSSWVSFSVPHINNFETNVY